MFSLEDTHREPDTPTAFPVDPDPTVAGMLGTQMVAAHLHVSAATGRLFELIACMEDTDAFQPTYANAAAWMRWHLGLDSRTARSYVRISRRLRDLPVTAAALSDGRLSLDRLKVLLRVVEADSETDLVEFAVACADVDTLRDRVADIENAPSPPEPRTIWDGPRATMWWRDDILHLNATIPGIDGATVEQAILRLAHNAPPDPQTGLYRDPSDRFGDALVQMGSQALAADGDHDRATVVVHIAAEELSTKTGVGYDTAGRLFGTSELDRLLCDARVQPALHDSDGITIGVGRITRTIPSWLARAIQERDKGCRFPSCDRTRWLHSHHIVHWANGGPTNLDNLVSLCGFHHRMLHNQGWQIEGNPNGELRFINQWGRPHVRPANPFPPGFTKIRAEHIDQRADEFIRELATSGSPP